MASLRLWDVNILVYAFRADSPFHAKAHTEIEEALLLSEPFLFLPKVAASFLRIVTNERIFKNPSSIAEAWTFVDCLESAQSAKKTDTDEMAFGIFKHLCYTSMAAGNLIPDVMLAAIAIRHGAEFVTADEGFLKYQGLKVRLIK